MSDICLFRDDAKNCIVLKDGEKLFTFTPEQWAVICMAANSDMENRLYAMKHGETLRLERGRTWADNREKVRRG
ncbi:hypothetical protein [Enterobacter hormaechei]|uniref:hypothetical protein n=1 Tax=Enterobacter hormaechei TaxID=158836 RepID=UPI0018C25CA4|nr:hypothetical protein [Enterobacter hormaechei]MBF9794816.1 hypothetical protein [Enterobacter hormaechei]HCD1470262.1 hypothetical protein [Enterobacter hormaechei]